MSQSNEGLEAGQSVEEQLQEPLLAGLGGPDGCNNDGVTATHENDDVICAPQGRIDESPLLQDGSSIDASAQSYDDDDAPTFWGLFFYRALYFLNGLSASTWGRFGVIYYNEVAHLTPEQIGILQGITPLISFLMMPLWGALADYCLQSRKQVYLFCKGMGTLCLMVLYVLQRRQPSGQDISFHIILICISGMSFFRASGVLDAFVLDYLGTSHRGLYGTIRLWTAISWGLGAVIMGCMTDQFGFGVNFILFGGMMLTTMTVVGVGLPARSKKEQARYDARSRVIAENYTHRQEEVASTLLISPAGHPSPGVLISALCRVPVMMWLFQVIVVGAGMALVDSFLFVYLQNDLHASTKLCGLTVGVTVLFELPIFHYSELLLQKVGHDALFATSMAAYVIRAFGYTLLTESTLYWILPLEVLHGITFACMWIAAIDFSAAVAPEQWSTTVQTFLSASFGCFGNVVGSVLGGWVLQHYSAKIMYRCMGCVVFGTLVLHMIFWLGCGRGHASYLRSISDQHENGLTDEVDDVEDARGEFGLGASTDDEGLIESADNDDSSKVVASASS
jgi:MFS family permease